MREELKKPLLDVVKIIIITVLVYILISKILPLIFPFFIALLAAKLIHPLVEKLNKIIRVKKGIITVFVSFIFLFITGGVFWHILKKIFHQTKNLFGNINIYQEKVENFLCEACNMVSSFTGVQVDTINNMVSEHLPNVWKQLEEKMVPALMNGSFVYAKNAFLLIGVTIITCVSTILILNDYTKIKSNMENTILGKSTLNVCQRVYFAGGAYFKSQLIIMVIVSIVCMVGLFFAGNEYAFVAGWGIGLCDAMPFLGTGTIFIPWAILEIAKGKYMVAAIYAVIYVICTLLREILAPKLLGNKLGVHPIIIIITIYIGLFIYGLWGFALGPITYIMIREIWKEVRVEEEEEDYLRYP